MSSMAWGKRGEEFVDMQATGPIWSQFSIYQYCLKSLDKITDPS